MKILPLPLFSEFAVTVEYGWSAFQRTWFGLCPVSFYLVYNEQVLQRLKTLLIQVFSVGRQFGTTRQLVRSE